jgi:hypothetical protein
VLRFGVHAKEERGASSLESSVHLVWATTSWHIRHGKKISTRVVAHSSPVVRCHSGHFSAFLPSICAKN